MTAQFHAGQEVEVDFTQNLNVFGRDWQKAKFIRRIAKDVSYEVEFAHGIRAVFDVEHIRAVNKPLKVGFDNMGSMVIE